MPLLVYTYLVGSSFRMGIQGVQDKMQSSPFPNSFSKPHKNIKNDFMIEEKDILELNYCSFKQI